MSDREVVILSGVRTSIGDYGGSLKDMPPTELAARCVREAVARAKVDPKEIGQCVCGSGLQAIVSAAQYILLGDVDAAVAGGAESMSRAAYANVTQRWGARMGDAKVIDMMVGALTDPFDTIHMGVTAEAVATKCSVTREQADAFAVERPRRAAAAIADGRFKSHILPVELQGRKGPVRIDTDEHVRSDASL